MHNLITHFYHLNQHNQTFHQYADRDAQKHPYTAQTQQNSLPLNNPKILTKIINRPRISKFFQTNKSKYPNITY